MDIYFQDKDFNIYKIKEITYNDENYDSYSGTTVLIEKDNIITKYWFNGILSLENIIRELIKEI